MTFVRLSAIAIALLSLVACGGSDDDSGARTTSPVATHVAQAEPTATEANETEPTATTDAADPTNTMAPTNTPAPTATATTAPTATPESERADVVAGKWKIEPNSIGSIWFYGEAVNQGTGTAMQVQVVVTLRDAANTVIASQTASVGGFIPGGEMRPFKGIFVNVDPAAIASQDIQIQYEDFDSTSFYADLYTIDFAINQPQWTLDHVTGEVQNIGDVSAEFVQIVGIGYNAAGDVIAVENTYSQLDRLDPGQSSPFDIAMFGKTEAPATFQIFANGNIMD